jgi:cold shock CspA family protein
VERSEEKSGSEVLPNRPLIVHDGSNIKILVHISTLEKAELATLEVGQRVHFSVLKNDLGNFVAIDLTLDD